MVLVSFSYFTVPKKVYKKQDYKESSNQTGKIGFESEGEQCENRNAYKSE